MTGPNGPGPSQPAGGSEEPIWLEVGTIGKAHGLKGEVVIDFVTDRIDERTAVGAELRLGQRTMVVATARPHQKKWLVLFEGIDDRTEAERLRGSVLEAEALDDPDALFVHELIDKIVVDQHGTRHGRVAAVVENPASDLLELDDGRLVPLAFVVDDDAVPTGTEPAAVADDVARGPDDTDPQVVRVSVPPGLLDGETLG